MHVKENSQQLLFNIYKFLWAVVDDPLQGKVFWIYCIYFPCNILNLPQCHLYPYPVDIVFNIVLVISLKLLF
jgi:hypothetical protein